jgi:hypothetical protein
MKPTHTYSILSYIRSVIVLKQHRSNDLYLSFSDMAYTADGARVLVDEGGQKYELLIRPIELADNQGEET